MRATGLVLILVIFSIITYAQKNQVINVDNDIRLYGLGDSVYIHETWHQFGNMGRFGSNGLVILNKGKALMIDTPPDNAKTVRLVKYIKDSLFAETEMLIAGHYHEDCLGGLGYLKEMGVKSIANYMTVEKCRELELPIPDIQFKDDYSFDFYGRQIECRYLGAGHSADNIVVWLPGSQILFGGCLVKSAGSENLGNTADAVIEEWGTTIQKLQISFPGVKVVVPGHGKAGGSELLSHTFRLAEDEKNKAGK